MPAEDITITQEKSWSRIFFRILLLSIVLCVAAFLLSIFCFQVIKFSFTLSPSSGVGSFDFSFKNFFSSPLYLFEVYSSWWAVLLKSFRLMDFRLVLLLPFLIPFMVCTCLIYFLVREKFSFSLWYILNYHFAKSADIEHIGLFWGKFAALGRFSGRLLRSCFSGAVLCIGETGAGKTVGVAVPSILSLDNSSVIAVDMMGLLAKYTSGHRAKVGKVFCYNWDLEDEPEKGLFYPRWNPLAAEYLPSSSQSKEIYFRRIIGYLISEDESAVGTYLTVLAQEFLTGLTAYLTSKISQASANDYFLNRLVEGKHLTQEDKALLLTYYGAMPAGFVQKSLDVLNEGALGEDDYFPVGSWAGIPEQWIGKEVCFALIADWFLFNLKHTLDSNGIDWCGWIKSLIKETVLFGYNQFIVSCLMQILNLSSKQRRIVFEQVSVGLEIFSGSAARERTNGNTLSFDDVRKGGVSDKGMVSPVTIYSVVHSTASKILTQMFLDEMLKYQLHCRTGQEALPLTIVFDDVWPKLKLKELRALLRNGESKKILTLFLCSRLDILDQIYGREFVESLVRHTPFKIIKAQDAQGTARQLDKLALFSTKSVQIPRIEQAKRLGKRRWFADSTYFHRLAICFRLKKNVTIDMTEHQIVLVEGYYHRPILAESLSFAKDAEFKEMALENVSYGLSQEYITCVAQTPKAEFSNVFFSDSFETKKKNTLTGTVSPIQEASVKMPQSAQDWWLEENAFEISSENKRNPFRAKK